MYSCVTNALWHATGNIIPPMNSNRLTTIKKYRNPSNLWAYTIYTYNSYVWHTHLYTLTLIPVVKLSKHEKCYGDAFWIVIASSTFSLGKIR